jgi:galactose mutarotase-like enzyme
MHSGLLMVIAGAALLLAIGVGLKERGHGHLGRLKTALNVSAPLPHKTKAVQPGGQDAIVLQRMQMANATIPEFLSATLLPGHGMNVLQITAYVPGKGEVKLLASPSLEDAAKLLDGHGKSVPANTSFGGEIEVPWAGRIWGTARPDDANIAALWHGHSLNLPTDGNATGNASGIASIHGLLLGRNADSIKTNVMPDGGQAQAIYNAGDFDGHWISQTQVTITVQLSGRALEMNIAARNTGKVAEPIGIGWHPRFAILSGDRKQAILKLPTALRVESRQGVPSGKLLPVEGTTYDFVGRNGARLGNRDLDDTFVHLKPGLLDNGPIAELRDPASNFGLRVTAITPTIKAMHVYAPPNAPFVSIDPQFNYDDPFGHEWAKGEDTGMEVLEPGQTVQWKIRLEIFSLSAPSPSQRL